MCRYVCCPYLYTKGGLENTTLSQFRRADVAPFTNSTYIILILQEKLHDSWIEQSTPVMALSGKSFGMFESRQEDSREKLLMWGIPKIILHLTKSL